MSELAEYQAQLDAKQPAWEASQAAPAWTVLEPADMQATSGATFARQGDQSVLVEGASARGTYTITLPTDVVPITAIRLELLADPKLPSGGPGRAPNGNVTLSEIRATATAKADPAKSLPLAFARATADFSQEGYPVASAIDGNPQTHWAIHPQVGKNHAAIFEPKEELNLTGGTVLTLTLDQQYDEVHTIGKFRISVTSAKQPAAAPSAPEKIREILALAPEARTAEQKAELAAHYRSLDAKWMRISQAAATSAEQLKNERLTGSRTWRGR